MEPNSVPTRNRLSAAAMLAPTEEERLAAKRLLQAGLYRSANKDELSWEDHPFNLTARYPADSPLGELIESIVNAQELELGSEMLEMPVTELKPLLPLPPKAPAAPTEEIASSLKKLLEAKNPVRPESKKPNWTVAQPTPPEDLGERRPISW
jgi:hypothetical protein